MKQSSRPRAVTPPRLLPLFIAVMSLLFYPTATAQELSRDSDDLRIGVALSGGGAKGLAHIGVLKVLEEAGIRIDYITGTSIGSIVGALYAIGYTPDELMEIAKTTDWDQVFSDRPNRRLLSMYEKQIDERFFVSFPITDRGIRLPGGVVAGQNIFTWLTRHTWEVLDVEDFSTFPIPFATVATDLETGDAVVFRSGYLPDAIRASISFPSVLTPHRVDGRSLIDGGLIRNIPVEEAFEMGADYVIAIDVSSPLQSSEMLGSMASILNQALHYRVIEKLNEQKKLADMIIEVKNLERYGITAFSHADELLQAGQTSARASFYELEQLASRQSYVPQPVRRSDRCQEVTVNSVSVSGNEYVSQDVILNELALLQGRTVSTGEIEGIIQQLYSSRLFLLITYRLYKDQTADHGYRLELRVVENTEDSFQAGARYESQTQASIMMQALFRNPWHGGSSHRTQLRLGRDIAFLTDYLVYGTASNLGFNTRVGYTREQISYFERGQRLSTLMDHRIRADLFAGTYLNPTYLIGAGIRKDFTFTTQEINPELAPFTASDYHAVYGRFMLETFNRRSWTTRGQKIFLQTTLSDEFFGSPVNFNEQRLFWQAWHPVSGSFSLQHTLYLGRSEGEELPWSYWFSPNRRDPDLGMIRFGGFQRHELTGRNIQMLSAGIQYEFFRHRFIRFDAYFGNTFEEWSLNIGENRYRSGFSLSAGGLTILGPIELILSGSSRNPVLWELQIGYEF